MRTTLRKNAFYTILNKTEQNRTIQSNQIEQHAHQAKVK